MKNNLVWGIYINIHRFPGPRPTRDLWLTSLGPRQGSCSIPARVGLDAYTQHMLIFYSSTHKISLILLTLTLALTAFGDSPEVLGAEGLACEDLIGSSTDTLNICC